MDIELRRVSNEVHAVTVRRADGSHERVELNTRSFLRHDLAHYAVEIEVPLPHGVWGSVAAGGSLASGDGLDGPDLSIAESLSGPVQTLMRIEAPVEAYREVLARVDDPRIAAADADDLAARLHERVRQLRGRWNATPFGGSMELSWPESGSGPPTVS